MSGSVSMIDGHIDGKMGDEAWELFSLITSVYYGKAYYFREKHGMVYSRASHEYMTADEAVSEFLSAIGW